MPPDPCPTVPGLLACPTPVPSAHPGLTPAELAALGDQLGTVLAVVVVVGFVAVVLAISMAILITTSTSRR